MNEISETWRWLISGYVTLLSGVILWRSNQIAGEIRAIWKEIGKVREELGKISQDQHTHEVNALNARLDIQKQLTEILVNHNTVSIDARNTAEGVARLEKSIDHRMGRMEENIKEIAKEVKK